METISSTEITIATVVPVDIVTATETVATTDTEITTSVDTSAYTNDNIEDDEGDEQLARFIEDMESAGELPTQDTQPKLGIADLYIKHLSAPTYATTYYDDGFEEYVIPEETIRPERVIDNVGEALSLGKGFRVPSSISNVNYSGFGKKPSTPSIHPSTSGYKNYPTSGWSKFASRYDYLDDDTDSAFGTNGVEENIDAIGDRVELIYDCVRSTDQILNDLYEKHIVVGDSVDELVESARGTTIRTAEINSRLTEVEKTQRLIAEDQAHTRNQMLKMTELLLEIQKDIRLHIYGPPEY